MKTLITILICCFVCSIYCQTYTVRCSIGNVLNPGAILISHDTQGIKPQRLGILDGQESIPNSIIVSITDTTCYYIPNGTKIEFERDIPVKTDNKNFTDSYYLIKVLSLPNESNSDEVTVVMGNSYLINDKYKNDVYIKFNKGFVYGALVVPFKWRFNKSRNIITPNASVGPYIGYKWQRIPYLTLQNLSIVGTAGLTGITLNDVNSNELETAYGITYAGGIILSYKSTVQFGIVGGWDMLGGIKGASWNYENKFWLSFSTGYSFLN